MLETSLLSEIYPDSYFSNGFLDQNSIRLAAQRDFLDLDSPPEYIELSTPSDLDFTKFIKPGDKLRVVNDKLQVDKRFTISRHFSKDSRNRTMEFLDILSVKYPNNKDLKKAKECLAITYKKDKKILEQLQ